ncbi:MAG: DUF4912 domain-containing protein [Oscillatoriales cyanobacterium C42_A2020_001]|nr:DUF4912 domain-containing protein [Leptolyngbyaceae cyanobacterium C42_A2020_001]
MSRNRNTPSSLWRPLLSLAAAPLLLLTVWAAINSNKPLLAQAPTSEPSFTLPSSLPNGTEVKLDGSSSMTVINEALKQRFQEKFPGTTLNLAANGSSEALQALLRGDIDLAAVGRSLTNAEKVQGLKQVPVSREKIAIFVGADNPFNGSLTAEQFAKIFRGEITDWSQVGGTPGPIRFIDRPDTSDTRQALRQYPVFQAAPFATGSTATQVADDTAAVVKELGKDGISYGIASQVVNRPGVKVLPMHETLPTDPRYPYSQLRSYVYKGEPNPQVQAFLGFATSAPGQEAVQEARKQEAAVVPVPVPVPVPEATTAPRETTPPGTAPEAITAPSETTPPGAAPTSEATVVPDPAISPTAPVKPVDWSPLWWLLLPLLGLPLLLWLMRGRGAVAVPPAWGHRSRIILTPRNCRDGYAYWEVPQEAFAEAREQGGRDLQLRLYDVTGIQDMDRQTPHEMKEFSCQESDRDLHVPIPIDDRDYVAELGYLTAENRWIRLARSNHVRVPACAPSGNSGWKTPATIATGGAIATGAVAAARSLTPDRASAPSRVIMVPRNSQDAYVYWEVPETHKAELKAQGGQKLIVRVHDVTDANQSGAASVRQYEADERSPDLHVPIPAPHRNYIAELGYVTQTNQWLSIGRSAPVRVPSTAISSSSPLDAAAQAAATKLASDVDVRPPATAGLVDGITNRLDGMGNLAEDATKALSNAFGKAGQTATNLTGDATKAIGAAIAGGAAAVAGVSPLAKSFLEPQSQEQGTQPQQKEDCRIILVPRNSKNAYAYWEVTAAYRQLLREQGGRRLMLRIHDATNIDIDYESPHSTQTYVCNEAEQDKHVAIPVSDRDYIAELGYFTDDNRWLRLIRSFHVHVPAENQ